MTEFETAVIAALISAFLTAILTHYANLRREKNVSKQKIIGWLEWLKSFLEENKSFPHPSQRVEKLPWWSDHALQSIGNSLYSINSIAREKLKTIVRQCWTEDPVKENIPSPDKTKTVDTIYDDRKVDAMKKDIEALIKQIRDP